MVSQKFCQLEWYTIKLMIPPSNLGGGSLFFAVLLCTRRFFQSHIFPTQFSHHHHYSSTVGNFGARENYYFISINC